MEDSRMSWYKLVPSREPHRFYDEVKFNGDEGEEKTASVHTATELTDADVSELEGLGYAVVEVDEPKNTTRQEVGIDVAGMSPVIGQSPATGEPQLSQREQQAIQQQEADTDQGVTTDHGVFDAGEDNPNEQSH
jgi:hypothetical protein